MVSFTKKETAKTVSFASLKVNEIFYYENRYWMKTYPFRDYDSSMTYNAHTIDGDCEFDTFDEFTEVITGEVEIITTF